MLGGLFSYGVQLLLALSALLTLLYKRWVERPQRPVKIWAMDVSKQAAGSGVAHVRGRAPCRPHPHPIGSRPRIAPLTAARALAAVQPPYGINSRPPVHGPGPVCVVLCQLCDRHLPRRLCRVALPSPPPPTRRRLRTGAPQGYGRVWQAAALDVRAAVAPRGGRRGQLPRWRSPSPPLPAPASVWLAQIVAWIAIIVMTKLVLGVLVIALHVPLGDFAKSMFVIFAGKADIELLFVMVCSARGGRSWSQCGPRPHRPDPSPPPLPFRYLPPPFSTSFSSGSVRRTRAQSRRGRTATGSLPLARCR